MICLSEDDYVRELQDRGTALWLASLSDGTTAFMDDGRPGLGEHSAWVRLATHVREGGLRLRGLSLRFRGHREAGILPDDADGYYFCKSALGTFGQDVTMGFYLVGALRGRRMEVQRWSVPELILVEREERDPARAGKCLIPCRAH